MECELFERAGWSFAGGTQLIESGCAFDLFAAAAISFEHLSHELEFF